MENQEISRKTLSVLLQSPVGELQLVETESRKQAKRDGKYVRLDLFAKDDLGRIYDAEMQNRSSHLRVQEELPKRSHYYHSMIDSNELKSGVSYLKLPATYVVFVCTFDPFGEGLFQYTFKKRCEENSAITR